MAEPVASSPVVRASLADQLAERVLELIDASALRPGDRLPSVGALAERFGVAIPTLREALRRLEATGVVDIRHGSGVYVHPNAERILMVNPYALTLEIGTVLELLDARLLIEPALAEMAAERATDADLAALEALLDEAERHLRGGERDDDVLHRVNQSFHSRVAACAGNGVLSQMIGSLHALHLKEQVAIFYLVNDPSADHAQHRAILDALRQRKPNKARKLMKKHVQNVRDVVAGHDGAGTA